MGFVYTTHRANPVVWNILKRCAWSDATIGVAFCRVINIATNLTNILFHRPFVF